ncbi:uncharacterized protein LOC110858132 [Folsomia candida]|uniref:uncharacterized protein LOC110858132 n=1 Tax=Folsomia candida TaxID=158441 RepID=UPI000B906201|nr:uncharacterized protein LOC110858132 [Folsomia candida]
MANTASYHPLLNCLVTRNILKHVDRSLRKHLRLVCSHWNQVIATSYLGKDCVLLLDDVNLEEFINYIGTSMLPESQFENIRIKINSSFSLEPNVQIVDDFWQTAKFMRFLSMEITTLFAKERLENLILYNLPNLQSLKITITKFWDYCDVNNDNCRKISRPGNKISPNYNLTKFSYIDLTSVEILGFQATEINEFDFPIEFYDFFKRYPRVNSLSFIGLSTRDVSKLADFLQTLQQEKVHLNLEILEILDENMCATAPNDDHIKSFSKLATSHFEKLSQLHLELTPELDLVLLYELLRKLRISLKILKLRRFPLMHDMTPITFTNTNLSNVTFLEVSNELVESLDFLPLNFPKLQTLHIIMRDYRHLEPTSVIQNTVMNNFPVLNHVQTLFIEQPLQSEDCIERICHLFPNLISLKLRMNNAMMHELCKSKPQCLERLHIISWDGLTDEGFTGISDHLLRNVGWMDNYEEYRYQAYIGVLKSLNELIVEMWPDCSNRISDASVYFGFLDLPNLANFLGIRTQITSTAAKRFSKSVHWCLEE